MFEALATFDLAQDQPGFLDVGVRVDDASEAWEREG
jgi:hypothetical protein